ncbi:hypothetical protein, partial [Agathobacter sp.]
VSGIKIESQPQNITANIGEKAAASVKASGNGLTYQWQYSNDGGKTWRNSGIASAKTATYSFTVSKNDIGMYYRCVIKDTNGNSVTSASGHLVSGIKIESQPQNITANIGEKAAASVKASGNGLTYQWQYSNDGGKTWRNSGIASAKTATYSFTVSKNDIGMYYRCVIKDTNGNSVTSASGHLVSGIKIESQPQNITANIGEKAAASVKASGNGLTYQWQYSNDGGKTWKNSGIASAKTATYSFTVSKNDVGMLFRCVIRDQYGNEKVSNNGILNTLKNEDWELPIM